MKDQIRDDPLVVVGLCFILSLGSGCSRTPLKTKITAQQETIEMHHASGTFEVKLVPQAPDNHVGDPSVGRMSIDKQFHGDLEATSKGQMLSVLTEVKGSAGYVAMERVTGTLHGHSGTFALQHSGTMALGVQALTVTVVPDSGTGELVGLTGTMTIDIEEGKHFYGFEYMLVEPL